MASNDNVLFRRGDKNNQDDDVWDDRALIKAYDKSIRQIKKAISSKLDSKGGASTSKTTVLVSEAGEEDSDDDEEEEEEEDVEEYEEEEEYEDQDTELTTQTETESEAQKWSVGQACLAVYAEDGLEYPAKMVKIFPSKSAAKSEDQRDRKCLIRYDVYLNEEEKYLSELRRPVVKKKSKRRDEAATAHPAPEQPSTKSEDISESLASRFQSLPFSAQSVPPPPPPPPLLNLLKQNRGAETGSLSANAASEDDALYSMLMSWYMSGYQTGYYFGLKSASTKNPNKNSK